MFRQFKRAFSNHIHENILSTVGNTPIVRLPNVSPANVNMFAKLEYFNPLSSVKDRLALGVIEAAEASGELKPGQTVVEATSGNTGIAVAMVCAQKGYPCVITMAETFSVERRKVMRFLGAKVVLTPAAQKGSGMVAKAEELAKEHGWFLPSQFENEANRNFHAKTTATEIISSFSRNNNKLDYFVSGYGTGGTFTGVGSMLRVASPDTKVILAEPKAAPLIQSGVPQGDHASHPSFTPHPIQGWTPDFIPKITEKGRQEELFDELILVDGPDGIQGSKTLATKEGIFTGISGGSSFAAALEVAKTAPDGSNILCMIPDTAERYLSTPLFADIDENMNESELEISKSTSNFQLE
eukprot:snap_masked-scaffold_1-processed-gene-8.38-mRNA-1 protein AED:0.07 eAED:0.07 QI:0/-1/0/1/-1/1/1/0/353